MHVESKVSCSSETDCASPSRFAKQRITHENAESINSNFPGDFRVPQPNIVCSIFELSRRIASNCS